MADPFRGPEAGTRVEEIAPPAAFALETISRPVLPPTPPELEPLNPAEYQALVSEPVEPATEPEALASTQALPPEFPQSVELPDERQPTEIARPATPASLIAKEQAEADKLKTKKKRGRKSRMKGSGSSTLKPLISVLAGLAVIAALVYFLIPLLDRGTTVSDLATGECIADFFESSADGSFIEVSSLEIVDCAEPHAYEVFNVSSSVFEGDFPGVEEAFEIGEEHCLNAYEEFIGGGRQNLLTWEVWTFVPPEAAWSSGATVQCVVGDINQEDLLTGTLRGAAE